MLDGSGVFLGSGVDCVHSGWWREVNERILGAKNVDIKKKGRAVAATGTGENVVGKGDEEQRVEPCAMRRLEMP